MKTVKQVVAVLVWCVVSVGCVADEIRRPAIEEEASISTKTVIQEQSEPSSDEEIIITTYIDQDTGDEFKEITGILSVTDINIKRSSIRRLFLINNLIFIDQITGGPGGSFKNYGVVNFPADHYQNNRENLIGKKVEIYCRETSPNNIYKAKHYCSLSGKNQYYINFK